MAVTESIQTKATMNNPFTLSLKELLGNQPTTPTVSPSSRMEEEEEERKIEKRLERLASCQSWAWHPDPYTGARFSYQIICGYWRTEETHEGCSFCLNKRKNEFKKRGDNCRDWLGDHLGILQMSDKEFKKLARKFRKNFVAYWRIPIKDSCVIVLFDGYLFPELSTLNYEDLDWLSLCQTPKGRQYSGSLCYEKKEEKEKHDDDIVVSFEQFSPSGLDYQQKKEVWDKAVKATNHLHPIFDVDKIQYAMFERMRVFEEFILEAGGEIKHKSMKRVRMSKSLYQNWIYGDDEEIETLPIEPLGLDYEQAIADLGFP